MSGQLDQRVRTLWGPHLEGAETLACACYLDREAHRATGGASGSGVGDPKEGPRTNKLGTVRSVRYEYADAVGVDLAASSEFLREHPQLLCAVTDRRVLLASPEKGLLALFRQRRPGQLVHAAPVSGSTLAYLDFEGRRDERYRLVHFDFGDGQDLIRYVSLTNAAKWGGGGEPDLLIAAIHGSVEFTADLAIRDAGTWGSDG